MALEKSKENIDTYEKWVLGGYQYFSEVGPDNFSIKELSEILELSRTSFHYYFESKDEFFDCLIEHHMEEVKKFGDYAIKSGADVTEGLMKAMEKLSTGMKFHMQLFIHRKIPKFDAAYLKGHEINFNNGILDWFLNFFELKMSKEEGKKAYLIFVDVLNSRFSYLMQTKKHNCTFSTLFIDVINDFISMLSSYSPKKSKI